MSFDTLAYALFLPCIFLIYWAVMWRDHRLGALAQNLITVGGSYVFYGWWDWRFLILIFLTTVFSYSSGLLLGRFQSKRRRKMVLWTAIGLNLGFLGFFKYYNFFTENFQALLAPFGIRLDSITLDLILPVGISFYTFQAMSYTIDVYRRSINPTRNIPAFFAFISFFPQLVAGPIERATNLLPQFFRRRSFDYAQAVDGCRQILWGLFKKMVIANNCAAYVDIVFSEPEAFDGVNHWLAVLLFTFQIYGDFSGYSDIAIGTAKLFGIRLRRNFNLPYFSRNMAEFWRRWHISLNSWFRDYVYIPLGGSRAGKAKTARNATAVFLLSGLWHGAAWNFVVWGVYNAVLVVPLMLSGRSRKERAPLPAMAESLLMGWTFLLVAVGWMIFRVENLRHIAIFLKGMFSNPHLVWTGIFPDGIFVWIAVMMLVEWISRPRNHGLDFAGNGLLRFRAVRWAVYIALIGVIAVCRGYQGDFIYFQF